MSVEAGLRSPVCVGCDWVGKRCTTEASIVLVLGPPGTAAARPAPPRTLSQRSFVLNYRTFSARHRRTAPPPRQLPARHSTPSFTSWNPFITIPAGQSLARRSWRTAADTSLNSQFADALQHSDGGL